MDSSEEFSPHQFSTPTKQQCHTGRSEKSCGITLFIDIPSNYKVKVDLIRGKETSPSPVVSIIEISASAYMIRIRNNGMYKYYLWSVLLLRNLFYLIIDILHRYISK